MEILKVKSLQSSIEEQQSWKADLLDIKTYFKITKIMTVCYCVRI